MGILFGSAPRAFCCVFCTAVALLLAFFVRLATDSRNQINSIASHSLHAGTNKARPILESSYGYYLATSEECDFWWCEGTYKVGRSRALPADHSPTVQIACARNEFEPFQVVLRPKSAIRELKIIVSDFVSRQGLESFTLSNTNIEVYMVEYVSVTTNTDVIYGSTGPHPDPLPLLKGPVSSLTKGINQPFWFSVFVSKETPPGFYEGTVTFSSRNPVTVPVKLQVFSFALPDTTHTRTAYFADVNDDWHKPTNLAQRRKIWDLYMENFRRHRVCPYSAHLYAPLNWELTNVMTGAFSLDYSDFDVAMSKYIDDFGFNSYNLFGHKSAPFPRNLGGHADFCGEWRRLFAQLMKSISTHLHERAWMDEAYCYWIDEPEPSLFPSVTRGMNALGECAPGVKRILTLSHYPSQGWDSEFDRNVDIWVPVLHLYETNKLRLQQRLEAGEENWWYVCMVPKGPYPNNFVDHPAINHRLRFWLADKNHISGDLYWSVNYWANRNPWTNAWTFGNGDGVLLYPPVKTPPKDQVLEGPVNSIRWELTREGLEDREYFWLLTEALINARKKAGTNYAAIEEGHSALLAAYQLVPSATEFSQDPKELYLARKRIASAIEALDDGSPRIVKFPQPRRVRKGENVIFRVDALGWPLPAVQWFHNGTLLNGTSEYKLVLPNVTSEDAGAYSIIVSNTVGCAASTPFLLDVIGTNGLQSAFK